MELWASVLARTTEGSQISQGQWMYPENRELLQLHLRRQMEAWMEIATTPEPVSLPFRGLLVIQLVQMTDFLVCFPSKGEELLRQPADGPATRKSGRSSRRALRQLEMPQVKEGPEEESPSS